MTDLLARLPDSAVSSQRGLDVLEGNIGPLPKECVRSIVAVNLDLEFVANLG